MGLLRFERALTTPKHFLSNLDFKTLEKRIGRRRSNLLTLSSINMALMCFNGGLPKQPDTLIQMVGSRAKKMLPIGRKHPEAAGGSAEAEASS